VLARAASASVTLAPPFLSAQPCILVLAAIPASVLIALRVLWRRAGAREPDQPESAAPWAAYSSPSSSPAMRSSG
jgi:hypothetical protein